MNVPLLDDLGWIDDNFERVKEYLTKCKAKSHQIDSIDLGTSLKHFCWYCGFAYQEVTHADNKK